MRLTYNLSFLKSIKDLKPFILCRQIYILIILFFISIYFNDIISVIGFNILFLKRIIIVYSILLILLLPNRIALYTILSGLILAAGLEFCNETKIAALKMPITILDLKINMYRPWELLNVIKAPSWTKYVMFFLFFIISVLFITLFIKFICFLLNNIKRECRAKFIPIVIVLTISSWSSFNFMQNYVTAINNYTDINEYWNDKFMTKIYRELGILGFYTSLINKERHDSEFFFNIKTIKAAPPPINDIRDAIMSFVNISANKSNKKPNIVIIIAESTFDPNYVFKLSKPVNNKLFIKTEFTHALGPLSVNTVGGGTWITEFELMTGIDSRYFGYSGYYTHSLLLPYVNYSLPLYLKEFGYINEAYYAISGNFYNATNAYKKYGFDSFIDNVGDNGWSSTDINVISNVIGLSKKSKRPFFKLIVTIENHSPHKCTNFSNKNQFITTFEGIDEFNDLNCSLNEYVRNLKSTEAAFLKMLRYLQHIENITKNPYVLLILGDHQPHTFFNYHVKYSNKVKTRKKFEDISKITFFHLVSSMPKLIDCCKNSPPDVATLPSLVSAYVAPSIDEIYLGLNFYKLKNCGHISKLLDNLNLTHPKVTNKKKERSCNIYSLVTAYRNTGIIGR